MENLNNIRPVHTKSSLLKGKTSAFKGVFHNTLKKTKANKPVSSKDVSNSFSSDIDMKKTRFEIYKFSKTGLDFSSRQKSNVDLAIQLGALPPKNEAKNYKKLKEEKQIETIKNSETLFLKQLSRRLKPNRNTVNKRVPAKFVKHSGQDKGILNTYGKVKHNKVKNKSKAKGKSL